MYAPCAWGRSPKSLETIIRMMAEADSWTVVAEFDDNSVAYAVTPEEGK